MSDTNPQPANGISADEQAQRETLKRLQGVTPETSEQPSALVITRQEAQDAVVALTQLDYGDEGLTRNDIRKQYKGLAPGIYLRLPSSRRFTSAQDVLHAASLAPSRAEGEFLGEDPDLPEAESLADGGPPAWGPTPLTTIDATEDSGSAEDRSTLQPE